MFTFKIALRIAGILKRIIYIFINVVGYFKPVPRGPIYKHELFETVTKTTALACQNFMMSLVAEDLILVQWKDLMKKN